MNNTQQTSIAGHFAMLKNDYENYLNINTSFLYNPYNKKIKGKFRLIEEPNDELKNLQKIIAFELQKNNSCPKYCFCGWKGKNNILNAKAHIGKREVITMDISHYFPNTKEKFVRRYFENCGITGEVLEWLIKATVYKEHLPTGASTSQILATLIHQPLFDIIYNSMKKQEIDFTLYVDDITLSSNTHISNNAIKYIKNVLKTHGLYLKSKKIKRFGYKLAVITGGVNKQCGRTEMPYKQGYEIIKMLKEENISQMSLEKVQKLIAKIGYIQQLHPNRFKTTKQKAIKQLKKLTKHVEKQERK